MGQSRLIDHVPSFSISATPWSALIAVSCATVDDWPSGDEFGKIPNSGCTLQGNFLLFSSTASCCKKKRSPSVFLWHDNKNNHRKSSGPHGWLVALFFSEMSAVEEQIRPCSKLETISSGTSTTSLSTVFHQIPSMSWTYKYICFPSCKPRMHENKRNADWIVAEWRLQSYSYRSVSTGSANVWFARVVLKTVTGRKWPEFFGVRFTSSVKSGDSLEASVWEVGRGPNGTVELAFPTKDLTTDNIVLAGRKWSGLYVHPL